MEKAVEALSAILGSVAGAILSIIGKAIGFLAENTWALIAFVAGLIGVWLMQKVKEGYKTFVSEVDICFFMISLRSCKNLFLNA